MCAITGMGVTPNDRDSRHEGLHAADCGRIHGLCVVGVVAAGEGAGDGPPSGNSAAWAYRSVAAIDEAPPHPVARVTSDAVVILPRLARALNAPAVAAVLGLILIAVGILGLATDDIRTCYAIVILIVGLINLVRTMAPRNGG